MRVSGHVCGELAKNICQGSFCPRLNLPIFARMQLNIAGWIGEGVNANAMASCLPNTREYIIQVGPSVNEGLALARQLSELKVVASVLFDSSGGQGREPESWPIAPNDICCGYAGGLGPDNLHTHLKLLGEIVGNSSIWVDMESGVRSEDGQALDLNNKQCLKIAAPFEKDPAMMAGT
jgi:hypothetical protein